MRKRIPVLLSVALFMMAYPCHGRVFFTGSNSQMTVFAFPQDIWLSPKDFAFYLGTWQTQPWWGDLDQPDLRPGTSYPLTGEKVGAKGAGDYFQYNAAFYHWKHTAGFTKTLSETMKVRFDLEYLFVPFSTGAEGAMSDAKGNRLRFDFSERHSMRDANFTSYWAVKRRTVPLGFKIGFGRHTASSPDCRWNILENDTAYFSTRNVWAWSTLQGSKLFDKYRTQARAWFQDEYTVGSFTRLDLQAAATLTRLKVGGRFRYNRGALDVFGWNRDTALTWADTSLYDNFAGRYVQTHAKKVTESTVRVYGNYNWIKREKFLFNTLALSRYTINDSTWVDPRVPDVSAGRTDRAGTFVLQINPNVNIYPWNNKFTYIDLAILCNYSRTNFDHRLRQAVIGGGQKVSWVKSDNLSIDDYSWLDFSYARQKYFEVALDVNPTFPIFGNRDQAVAMNVSMLVWTRFTWVDKYYGEFNAATAGFDVSAVRRNYEREIWLNSVWNIIYKRDAWVYRVIFGQPLIYSLSPQTRIYEADGKRPSIVTQVKEKNSWVSQSGAQIGFFVSSTLENLVRLPTEFGWPKRR